MTLAPEPEKSTTMKRMLLGCLCVAAAGCGEAPQLPTNDVRRAVPTGQLGGELIPSRYLLDLIIDPEADRFSGSVAIAVVLDVPQRDLFLHGKNLDVHSANLVTEGGAIFDGIYSEVDDSGVARIRLADTAPAGGATLNITYSAPFDNALEGLYRLEEGGHAYAFTQFQATSARHAFPGFDEPAFKTPFELSVTARPEDTVITNTPELGTTPAAGGLVTHTFATTTPLPTYLIAFAVGPLDVVDWTPIPPTGMRGQPVPLRGVAVRGKGEHLAYALDNTAPMLSILEDYFATAYPFAKLDLIAVPDFAAGAMENAGAITYREQLLLINGNAPLTQRRRHAVVHAHELSHMWFGDLVTPRWWDDIWLNESFATWMSNKVVDAWRPGEGFANQTLHGAFAAMDDDSLLSARQIRQPIESNHDVAAAFDSITYNKGAAVLAMFENFVGAQPFRAGVRLYMQRFAHGSADIHDFLAALSDGSENPAVADAFSTFLHQPGVPLVTASVSCNEGAALLSLTQSRYLPLGTAGSTNATWSVPVCIAYGTGAGRARQCSLMTESRAEVALAQDDCPHWMMPNENSAGYYLWRLDETALTRLLDHVDALTDREALSLHKSLDAGFHAGKVTTSALVRGLRVLAGATNREVATAPIGTLRTIHRDLVTQPAARRGVEAFVRELYRDRLNAIGLEGTSPLDADAPAKTALLRVDLVDALAHLGRDRELRATLAKQATAYLSDPTANPAVINPDLVEAALVVAVQEADPAFARSLLDRALGSNDAMFRQRALTALASSPDPQVGMLIRDLILDDRLRSNEAVLIPSVQSRTPEQREAMWRWLELNVDALVARMPTWRQGLIVLFADGFCDAARADEIASFFQPRIDGLAGGPRRLAQVLERTRLCAALVAATAADVNELFAEHDPDRHRQDESPEAPNSG